MSVTEFVLEGTLNADGTLVLDQKPSLSPGRVKVTLQAARTCTTPSRGLADVIDEIRQDRQVRGFKDRSVQEIEAGLREGEEDYEQRMQAVQSSTNRCRSVEGS